MARFVFHLEGLLRHRRHLERQRQRELAIAQGQMQQLKNELAQLDHAVKDAAQDMRASGLVGRLDMSYIAAHRRFVGAMQQKAMLLVQRIALAQRQVEAAQAALAESAKQRKIMEKLREKQYERWVWEQNRKEADMLEEIGTQLNVRHLQGLTATEIIDDAGEPA